MTDEADTSGPPSPKRRSGCDLANIRMEDGTSARIVRAQEKRLAAEAKKVTGVQRQFAGVRAAAQIGEQIRLAQEVRDFALHESASMKAARAFALQESASMKAARAFALQESAVMKEAREFARQESASMKAVREMERGIAQRAQAIDGIGDNFRQMTEQAKRAFESISSPAMEASIRMQEDLERTRRMIDPILEEHHKAERMLAMQMRQDRLLDDRIAELNRDSIFGRMGSSMRDMFVGADIPASDVVWFEDVATTAPPQLPSREAPTKRPARPKAKEKAMAFSVAASDSVGFSCALVSHIEYLPKPKTKRGRIKTIWRAVTKQRGATVVVALAGFGGAVATGALSASSPLTWVLALGLLYVGSHFRDRVTTLAREGLTQPEAIRQACREFFGRRPPEQ